MQKIELFSIVVLLVFVVAASGCTDSNTENNNMDQEMKQNQLNSAVTSYVNHYEGSTINENATIQIGNDTAFVSGTYNGHKYKGYWTWTGSEWKNKNFRRVS